MMQKDEDVPRHYKHKMITMLLYHGADVNFNESKKEYFPLFLALRNVFDPSIILSFFKFNVNLAYKTEEGHGCLYYAKQNPFYFQTLLKFDDEISNFFDDEEKMIEDFGKLLME